MFQVVIMIIYTKFHCLQQFLKSFLKLFFSNIFSYVGKRASFILLDQLNASS